MGEIAELVEEFMPRLRVARGPSGVEAFRMTLGDFCGVLRRLSGIEAEIASGLRSLLVERDPDRLVLWLHTAISRPSDGLVEPLCELLSVRDAYLQHEWVAELLGEIGNSRAVAALSDACSFDVEGDAFRSLPKRCLQALAGIGTPTASAAVEAQLLSPWPEIRQEAARLLAGGDTPDV